MEGGREDGREGQTERKGREGKRIKAREKGDEGRINC